eukprot:jgi/Orpsp1_1/1191569/evm.model.d7180000087059.1
MIKLLMDFSKENNIILEMDQKKKNKNDEYPVLYTTYNNNIEIVKILIEYAKNSKKFSIIDDKSDTKYPFLYAIHFNNIEIVKILMEYAK